MNLIHFCLKRFVGTYMRVLRTRFVHCVNACAILRPNNFDRPFILSFSVKNHLAPSGLERQHWCANQV